MSTTVNEDLIIRNLETKLARQKRLVAETEQHIAAMREIQEIRTAKEKLAKPPTK